ncbi:hypothetical protein HPB48_026746 [Haemaphysalis longicornis]|uniref:Uncharacterized protein n=1 Tax=Haemaphysalis longicornis TaxID=44386 RepID=A0A9J6H1W8_HAELO|nr:hypothetical protein HPB48_026746 [Haemaphysalis longicornis]
MSAIHTLTEEIETPRRERFEPTSAIASSVEQSTPAVEDDKDILDEAQPDTTLATKKREEVKTQVQGIKVGVKVSRDFNAAEMALGYSHSSIKERNLAQDAQDVDLVLITDPVHPARQGTVVSRKTTPDLTFIKNIGSRPASRHNSGATSEATHGHKNQVSTSGCMSRRKALADRHE